MLRFRNTVIFTLSLLIVFSTTGPLSLAITDIDKGTLKAAHQYEKFLISKSKEDSGALEAKDQFSKLSWAQKKKFLGYITNPRVIKTVLTTPVKKNTTKKLYNGDIEIENTTKVTDKIEMEEKSDDSLLSKIVSVFVEDTYAAFPKINRRVEETKTTKIFGIRLSSFTGWINYVAQSVSVISISSADGYCSINRLPLTQIKKVDTTTYIATRRAHLKVTWSGSFGFQGAGIDGVKALRLHLIGDHNGNSVAALSEV